VARRKIKRIVREKEIEGKEEQVKKREKQELRFTKGVKIFAD
jgi:hypothetical protein